MGLTTILGVCYSLGMKEKEKIQALKDAEKEDEYKQPFFTSLSQEEKLYMDMYGGGHETPNWLMMVGVATGIGMLLAIVLSM